MKSSSQRKLAHLSARLLTGAATIAICALLPHQAGAVTPTWTGTTNGVWNTGTNWTGGTAPVTAGDSAVFATAAPTTLTFTTSFSVGGITYNAGGAAYTYNATAGQVVTNTVGITNNSSNVQTFNATGAGSGYTFSAGNAANSAFGLTTGATLTFSGTGGIGAAQITTDATSNVVFTTSDAGTNTSHITDNGGVDISGAAGAITIGSISGSGTVTMGGNNLTTGGDNSSQTYSGIMSGSGAYTKTGTGTRTVSGGNNYTGGTTIANGTITLGANGALAASTGALALSSATSVFNLAGFNQTVGGLTGIAGSSITLGAGTLTFGDTTSGTYAGNITGTGSLVKNGTSTVIFSGTNGYSGGTTITTGTLQGTTTSLQGAFNDNAILNFNQNTNGTYAGVVSGTGAVTKDGSGVVIFNGANSNAGLTIVNGGSLEVGDATHASASIGSNALVGVAGILLGHGTIGGGLTNNGNVTPGGTIGTLTVNGNYLQNANGTLTIEVNPSVSSVLAVSGRVGLNGALALTPDAGVYVPYTHYTIITAGQGVGASQFSSVTDSAPNVATFQVNYFGTSVEIVSLPLSTFAASAASTPGETSNQAAVAVALDQAYPTATGDFRSVLNTLYFLPTSQEHNALTQLGGEFRGNTSTVTISNLMALHNTILARVDERQSLTPTQQSAGLRMNNFQVAMADTDDAGPLFSRGGDTRDVTTTDAVRSWVRGFGIFGDAGSSGTTGYGFTTGGIAVGADSLVQPGTLLGASLSYSHTDLAASNVVDDGKINSYRLTLYGSQKLDVIQLPLILDASASYGLDSYHDTRSINFPGISRIAESNHNGHDFAADAGVSHSFQYDQFTLVPRFGIQYDRVDQNSFTESGASSLDLATAQTHLRSFRTDLGAKGFKTFKLDNGMEITPELRANYLHDFAETNSPVTASFVGAPTANFTVNGVQVGRDTAVLGGGLSLALTQQVHAFVDYDASLRDNETDHTVSAGVQLTW